MRPQLNHSIVWCRDKVNSAGFLTRVLGLPDPHSFMLDRGPEDPIGHHLEVITRPYGYSGP